jgi:hypothetical protein
MGAALRWHLALGGSRLEELTFVLLDESTRRVFAEVLESALLGDDEHAVDLGLPHVAARIDDDGASGDAPTLAQSGPVSK